MQAASKIVLFKGKKYSNGECPIMLRITYNRKSKYISLGYTCLLSQWGDEVCRFKRSFEGYQSKNQVLRELESRAGQIIEGFIKQNKPFTFQLFEDEFLNKSKETTVSDFIHSLILEMEEKGKVSNRDVYKQTKGLLENFNKRKHLMFADINYKFLKGFEIYLFSRGCTGGGVHFYMRTLRAIVNEAIRRGYLPQELYPFSRQFNKNGYSIAHLKSEAKPRSLSIIDIEKVKKFSCKDYKHLEKSWQYFMFSYYARGMNFADMAKLEWTDIYNERVTYSRSKTKKSLNIKISEPIRRILSNFEGMHKRYIFPILNDLHQTEQQKKDRIHKCLRQFNNDLKEMAKILDINVPLTSYVARHSYATTLKNKGIDVTIISEGLGHSDITTTKAYLKNFETDIIDKADELL